MQCRSCDQSGFNNLDSIPENEVTKAEESSDFHEWILKYIAENAETDASVCHCCGDGDESWYGEPGSHYSNDDPQGPRGPYACNGGNCECD